jgi:hypothetical protein
MHEITNTMSDSKDKRVYIIAQGLLKRNVVNGVLKKCSVTSEYIENLGRTNVSLDAATVQIVNEGPTAARGIVVDEEIEQETEDPSFTWANITRKYKARARDMSDLNLNLWVARYWSSKCNTVPQFLVMMTQTWPLKEEYSK